MRLVDCAAVVLLLAPLALPAQQLAPALARASLGDSAPNGDWCFGVKLPPAGNRCANFTLLEIGARFRVSGKTDHSTQDPAHAYPTLDDHGYLALGLAHRVARASALGVVGEYGAGGGERQSLGIRFDQQLTRHARFDATVGALRVETHQRGVTRRRMAAGTFIDGAVRANDMLVIQARFDHVPGDGRLVKPANAAYIGARVEGGGAVKATIASAAIVSVLLVILFFGGGGGD